LTIENRRRGGYARAASITPLERAYSAMHAARARWAKTTPAERQAVARRLVEARHKRVPMMPASEWAAAQPKQPCERCGATQVKAYRAHPLETHRPPLWRCARHATAPASYAATFAYRRPESEERG